MQLLDQAVILFLQPPVAGGLDDRGVEGEVGCVVDVEIAGHVGGLHGVDEGFQLGDQRRRRDRGDDPACHGEQRRAQVVDLGRGPVVDLAHENATVGDADNQAVALDAPERLPHRAAADTETGCQLGLVQAGAFRDVAGNDEPRDLLRDQRGQRAAAPQFQQVGWRCAHGCITRDPIVDKRLTRTMIANVTSRSAMPRTDMAPRSPLSFRS